VVTALLVATLAATALGTLATHRAVRRSRARRSVVAVGPPPPPGVDEEREALLEVVGDTILERLGDDGLWLPDGRTVETMYAPLETVGGDFLGTLEVDGDAVALIGDVAGHGIDAALVALRVKEAVTEAIAAGASLEEAMGTGNDALRAGAADFATMFACRLDAEGRLTFVNAGHVPPLVIDGAPPDDLQPTGPLLGAFEHRYDEAEVDLEPGARLLAFTDGVTEAFGARGGLTEGEIRAAVAEPHRLDDLRRAVLGKRPDPVRDDIAAFELTTGGAQEDPPHG